MPTVTLYIQPGAKQSRIVGLHDGMPKIAIKARPIDGEANAALIEFLAELTKTQRSTIKLVAGHTSRIKKVEMQQVALDALQMALLTV